MMVLSRKANDQNRTILVIYSNHRLTSFGIITKNPDLRAAGRDNSVSGSLRRQASLPN